MRREWSYPVDWFCPTESCVDVCCWLLNGVVSWRCKARNSLWLLRSVVGHCGRLMVDVEGLQKLYRV
jgi:hypothetical protein